MVPKEQIQEHIVEELIDVQVTPRVVDVPFPQIQNQSVEVVNNVVRERVLGTHPGTELPETMDETVKVVQLMLQVQIRERIVEGIADVCVPQLMEERSEDQKSNPQMQVRNRTAKQTLDPDSPADSG